MTSAESRLFTQEQVSAGGVAYRRAVAGDGDAGLEIALIAVGEPVRWQLPKGLVDAGEAPEVAALREVREEAGITAELVAPIDTIEYWYWATRGGQRVRYHKRVHFFLMEYRSGDVADHDWEVREARWVPLPEAIAMLAFKSERAVVEKASLLRGR